MFELDETRAKKVKTVSLVCPLYGDYCSTIEIKLLRMSTYEMMYSYNANQLSSKSVGSCTLSSPSPTGGDYNCNIADKKGANLVLI